MLMHRLPHSAKPLHSKLSDDVFSCLECHQAALCTQREFAFTKFSPVSRILPQRGRKMDVKQSAFCPMKTDSLKDRVHDQILEMIIKNASTEDLVMNEKRLAELLNVSKLTVREALIMLCSEGVLKSVPRYGYLVIQVQESERQEAIWVRRLLETEALKCSFPLLGEEQLSALKEQIQSAASKKNVDVWRVWEDNEEFHLLLASFANNRVLNNCLKNCLDRLKRFYAQNYWKSKNTMVASVESGAHLEIYEQILKGNLKESLELLERDIDSGRI